VVVLVLVRGLIRAALVSYLAPTEPHSPEWLVHWSLQSDLTCACSPARLEPAARGTSLAETAGGGGGGTGPELTAGWLSSPDAPLLCCQSRAPLLSCASPTAGGARNDTPPPTAIEAMPSGC
jgi:hypothetical protein